MRSGVWRKTLGILVCGTVVVLLGAGTASGDDKTIDELKARLDKLEKQNEELRKNATSPVAAVNPYKPEVIEKEKIDKMIDSYMKEKDARKKAEDAYQAAKKQEEGHVVGSDLSLKARWNPQQGLLFETENRDFVSHLGIFVQWDTVSFSQTPSLKPPSQLGDLQDGTYFRRIRPIWDGRAYDFIEWNIVLGLEQINGSTANGTGNINLDEVWAGVYGVPLLGRIRAGHLKICQGLEGNQWSSSRAMTFMENSSFSNAFYNVFAPGVQVCNSALNDGCNGDRITWQYMGYRNDSPRGNTGEDFGDGDYAVTGRISALLFDEDQDRHFLHVGLSATWRKAQRAGDGLAGAETLDFRTQPELRDAVGGFGDGATLPGDNNRMVDTGVIAAASATVVGSELWYNVGAFSVMAEWAVAQLNGAVVPVTVGKTTHNVTGNLDFHGGYVTVSYFLTGETRAYDHDYGRESTFYIAQPFTNAFAKKNEDGGVVMGWGAWEVAARYSYLNLNDGPVDGGVMEGETLGLNWYLNSNLKVQVNYVHNMRYDKTTTPGGTKSGSVDGLGTEMQIQF